MRIKPIWAEGVTIGQFLLRCTGKGRIRDTWIVAKSLASSYQIFILRIRD